MYAKRPLLSKPRLTAETNGTITIKPFILDSLPFSWRLLTPEDELATTLNVSGVSSTTNQSPSASPVSTNQDPRKDFEVTWRFYNDWLSSDRELNRTSRIYIGSRGAVVVLSPVSVADKAKSDDFDL